MKSAFDGDQQLKNQTQLFLPPESFSSPMGLDEDDIGIELSSASSWDVATRYHEFKAKRSYQSIARRLRKVSVHAVMQRAQAVLGSVVHPVDLRMSTLAELPGGADQPELDLEETIDQSPHLLTGRVPAAAEDLWMSYSTPRRQSVVLSVDTSLSMTGEKLALTAVALAVVLLQFPDDPIGIVAFENEAKILKRPEEKISIAELVERFLEVPAQGYTHLEEGLRASLGMVKNQMSRGSQKPVSTVLLTDGKYTAGRDPSYLAPRFRHLIVLKMGNERASMSLCQDLASQGGGALKEVADLEDLPQVMYSVVKDLLRGRSLA